MQIVAFDFGTKKIGIAVGQTQTMTSSPLDIVFSKNNKIREIKKLIKELEGYITIIKTSNEFDYEETIFTVDDIRLLVSEKIKKSFDPKRIFNPGKMYRGI